MPRLVYRCPSAKIIRLSYKLCKPDRFNFESFIPVCPSLYALIAVGPQQRCHQDDGRRAFLVRSAALVPSLTLTTIFRTAVWTGNRLRFAHDLVESVRTRNRQRMSFESHRNATIGHVTNTAAWARSGFFDPRTLSVAPVLRRVPLNARPSVLTRRSSDIRGYCLANAPPRASNRLDSCAAHSWWTRSLDRVAPFSHSS